MGGQAAIYLPVSKGERHTDNQRPDVERVGSMRGLELVAEYEEKASVARVRPVIQRPCWSGRAGRVDGIERRRRGPRIVAVVERRDREAQQAISLEVPGGDSGRR